MTTTTTTTIHLTGETVAEFEARLTRIGEAIWRDLPDDVGDLPFRMYGRAVNSFRAGRYDDAAQFARLAWRSYLRVGRRPLRAAGWDAAVAIRGTSRRRMPQLLAGAPGRRPGGRTSVGSPRRPPTVMYHPVRQQ